jgi:type IV secretion system protein VirB4
MLDLFGFRRSIKGLPDLLPYIGLVAEGVVLNKDGSLTAAWEYRGSDTASSTREELDFVAAQANQAFMLLGTGWMIHVDAARRPATSYPDPSRSHFPDPISNLIDRERRAFFARESCFETSTVLTLTYKPARSVAMGLLTSRKSGQEIISEFQSSLDNFESLLSGVLELDRLGEYEEEDESGASHLYSSLLTHIQLCLTGDFQPVMVPRPVAMYLDGILGAYDLAGGLEPRLGHKHLAMLSIDGFPQESYPAILEMMSGLPLPYRFNVRYIALDQLDAIKEVENYRKSWAQQMFGLLDKYFDNPNAKVNRDAAAMNEDAEQAKADAQSGLLSFGFLTSTVALMNEDLDVVKKQAQYIQRELSLLGFGSRVETYNAVEAWLGSLPALWYANVRRPLVSTVNLAHLLPLASIWPGARDCPCPFYPPNSPPLMVCTTDGTTPFRFNLHCGDLGHTMILGPTGAGKSTLLGLICAQFRRYKESQTFVFDKGMSMYPLCLGVGGSHYDVGGEGSELAFAPLQRVDESEAEFAWACDWASKLFELQGLVLSPGDLNIITEGIFRLRNQPGHLRSLSMFMHLLQDSRLKEGLRHYCSGGPMSRLLDSDSDNLGLSSFIVFEIEELMGLGERNLIPVLLYLFHRIERALDGQPSLLVLDEAWIMLGNPVFQAQIKEWLKVLRKKNCVVVLATQSLSDASRSGILDVLAESCPTKVFLPNFEANNETQREQYRALGLNRRQVEIIARATPKRDYYVVSRDGRRLMQLALGRKALAFVGSSGKDDLNHIKAFRQQHGDGWIDAWLAHKQAA